jgi:hypothetical protein
LTEAEYNAAIATAEWDEHEKRLADTFAQEVEPAINAVKDATNSAEMAMRTYTEALLFKIASEGLSEDQALSLAYAMGLVDERTVMATEKTKLYKDWLEQGAITIDQYNALILKMGDYLDGLPKNIDINVHAKFINDVPSWVWDNTSPTMGGGGSSGGGFGGGFELRASGGDVRPGGSYVVGEHGMEILQLGADGRGMITPLNTSITNNYNLGVTTTQSLDSVMTGFAILQAMQ